MCGPCTLKIFLAVTSWPRVKHVASWFGLPFPHLFVALYIPTYHVHNNYIMHIVALLLYFSRLRTVALSTGIATMSSLVQLWVQDTEKQRQHRCTDARL